MRDLTFTHWASVTAKSGKPVTLTWTRWAEVLTKHEVIESKEGVGLLTLCTILAGKPRQNKNVITVDALCLDIDHGTRKQISAALRAFMQYEFVLHTTHSHGNPAIVPGSSTKEKPDGELALDEDGAPYPQTKIRVVFPLKRSIDKSEHRRIWRNFTTMSLDMNDEQTKAVSHPFYLPAARANPPAGGEPFIKHNSTGLWFDPDEHMEAEPEAVDALREDVSDFLVQEQVAKGRRLFGRMDKTHELREAATKLIAGEVFAKKGARHEVIVRLTGFLAFKTHKRPYSVRAVDAIFRPSIIEMQKADPTCDGVDSVVEAYATAIEKAKVAKKTQLIEEQKDKLGGQDFKAWTREDVEAAAEKQECEPGEIVYVVQREGAHYIANRAGYFTGPHSEKDVNVELFQALAASPVELYETTGEGYRRRALPDIVTQHGQIAEKVVVDLPAQRTWYSRKHRTLYEAVCPIRRDLLGGPARDPQLEKWLRLMTGPTHEKVLNWMACAADLNKLLCAITLAGPSSSGKNVFAEGMAALWSDAATEPEHILGSFNESIARCPLVFADESLPKTIKWDSVTTKLRHEIGTMRRTLNRKYRAPTDMKGSLRFILATNNPMILSSKISTAADLEAIAVRFLYVETTKEAKEYLETLPIDTKNRWRESGVARFALWLQENRQVEPEGRFWVMGSVSRMHRLLVTSSNWNSWCCEWIVKGLLDGYRKAAHKTETTNLVVIKDDTVFVNTNALVEGWSTYTNYPNVNPDPRHIATALRSISKAGKPVQISQPLGDSGEMTRFRYFEIDTNHLVAWAEENNVCAHEEITKAISVGTKHAPTVVNLDGTPHEKE